MSRLSCPCCSLPTLRRRGASEVCLVCRWEDGCESDSPNGGIALPVARRNFEHHGSIYPAGEENPVAARPSAARQAMRSFLAAGRSDPGRFAVLLSVLEDGE